MTSGVAWGLELMTCLDLPLWGVPRLVHSGLQLLGLLGLYMTSSRDMELRQLVIKEILGRGARPGSTVGVQAKGEGSREDVF